MVKLSKDLVEKKGVTESSATTYIRCLTTLNDKKPFTSLTFLKKYDDVLAKIEDYALSSRKNIITAVASILSLYKDSTGYKKAYKYYSDKLIELTEKQKEDRGDTSIKTDKENENWVEWKDIEEMREKMKDDIHKFVDNKNIGTSEYDKLLSYLILNLYTRIPPRRNADYQKMVVVRKWKPEMSKDTNYLDLYGKRFIFNVYKTAKTSGQQIVEIPDTEENPLYTIVSQYLKHNPHYKGSKSKAIEFPFLVKADGSEMTSVNCITRILNKLFGKKVGSSMLRHSYLSNKYGNVLEEMKADADAMAHDTNTQKEYIRIDKKDDA